MLRNMQLVELNEIPAHSHGHVCAAFGRIADRASVPFMCWVRFGMAPIAELLVVMMREQVECAGPTDGTGTESGVFTLG